MAHQDGRAGPFPRVAGLEIATDNRLNAEDLEKVGRDARNLGPRGLRRPRNRRDAVAVLRDRLEAAALVAEIHEVRVREPRPPALRGDLEDGHDPARVGVGQRPQQHAVDDAEDRRGHPDAEGQREHRDGSEARVLAELPKGVAAIGEHGHEERHAPPLSLCVQSPRRPSPHWDARKTSKVGSGCCEATLIPPDPRAGPPIPARSRGESRRRKGRRPAVVRPPHDR